MDLKESEKYKYSESQAFKTEYASLKSSYNRLIQQALNEQGDKTELITQILSVNTEMAKLVREYMQESPDDLEELTNELLKIQTQFQSIQKTKDRQKTLDMILNENKNQINKFKWKHDILLFLIGLCIIVILLCVFGFSIKTSIQELVPTSNQP
jgi:DNA-binding FrmR family transcriptional regulator